MFKKITHQLKRGFSIAFFNNLLCKALSFWQTLIFFQIFSLSSQNNAYYLLSLFAVADIFRPLGIATYVAKSKTQRTYKRRLSNAVTLDMLALCFRVFLLCIFATVSEITKTEFVALLIWVLTCQFESVSGSFRYNYKFYHLPLIESICIASTLIVLLFIKIPDTFEVLVIFYIFNRVTYRISEFIYFLITKNVKISISYIIYYNKNLLFLGLREYLFGIKNDLIILLVGFFFLPSVVAVKAAQLLLVIPNMLMSIVGVMQFQNIVRGRSFHASVFNRYFYISNIYLFSLALIVHTHLYSSIKLNFFKEIDLVILIGCSAFSNLMVWSAQRFIMFEAGGKFLESFYLLITLYAIFGIFYLCFDLFLRFHNPNINSGYVILFSVLCSYFLIKTIKDYNGKTRFA